MPSYDIRPAQSSDTEDILELLDLCMGKEHPIRTVDDWLWKHVYNPFGPSEALVAESEGRIIGLRVFMQWTWRTKDKTYNALRAVDTATHPDYRRQGIFKNLTLELVSRCREKGYDFIFNDPNENSRPGYLKMGWQEWTVPPVSVQILRPLRMGIHRLKGGIQKVLPRISAADRIERQRVRGWSGWDRLHSDYLMNTSFSPDYVQWRYIDCPVYTYGMRVNPGSMLLYRLQSSRYGPLLRICDWRWTENTDHNRLQQEWESLLEDYPVNAAYLPWIPGKSARKFRRQNRQWKTNSVSPMIVLRELKKGLALPSAERWEFSNGLLEIF